MALRDDVNNLVSRITVYGRSQSGNLRDLVEPGEIGDLGGLGSLPSESGPGCHASNGGVDFGDVERAEVCGVSGRVRVAKCTASASRHRPGRHGLSAGGGSRLPSRGSGMDRSGGGM